MNTTIVNESDIRRRKIIGLWALTLFSILFFVLFTWLSWPGPAERSFEYTLPAPLGPALGKVLPAIGEKNLFTGLRSGEIRNPRITNLSVWPRSLDVVIQAEQNGTAVQASFQLLILRGPEYFSYQFDPKTVEVNGGRLSAQLKVVNLQSVSSWLLSAFLALTTVASAAYPLVKAGWLRTACVIVALAGTLTVLFMTMIFFVL